MVNPNTVRILEPRERYAYHRAVFSKNQLARTSILMDGQILVAQKNKRHQACEHIPEFHEEIATLTAYAQTTIAESDRTSEGLWTDYYRLISQTAFLEQRLKVPFAFEKPTYWKERERLVNGTYGMSAHMIHEAMSEYDDISTRTIHENQLRGVIQEQTFIALFNREQQRNRLAIPSATYDDLHKKIDVDVWSLPDRHTKPLCLPVQVKSWQHNNEKCVTPKNGIAIYADEFNNTRNLAVSRLIADEYSYMIGEGEPLTPQQIQQLDNAHARLFATMEHKTGHTF